MSRIAFLVVAGFVALTSFLGGLVMALGSWLGPERLGLPPEVMIPNSMLVGSPFASFLVPGILLAVIVGGTHVAAVVLVMRKPPLGAVDGGGSRIFDPDLDLRPDGLHSVQRPAARLFPGGPCRSRIPSPDARTSRSRRSNPCPHRFRTSTFCTRCVGEQPSSLTSRRFPLRSWKARAIPKPRGRHHEIYLGDPRRSAPEVLRTLLRQPVQ